MKMKKSSLSVILLLIISIMFTEISSAIPKSETAVVDTLKVYWNYNRQAKNKKDSKTLKKEMLQNIGPLSNDIKSLKSL
jgi:Skp family chaperone for outer membrane proteins